MRFSDLTTMFSRRPWMCLALAALLVTLGMLLFTGWIPPSPSRPRWPGQEWVFLLIAILPAAYFLYCAAAGLKRGSSTHARSQNESRNDP